MNIVKRVHPSDSPYSVMNEQGVKVYFCNYEHEAKAFIKGYKLAKLEQPKSIEVYELLEPIWNALHSYRENGIPEGNPEYDALWSDICTNMAWIAEDLNKYHNTEEVDHD